MKLNLSNKLILVISLLLATYIQSFAQAAPKRELRGVWIASVMNLDFPSSNKLSSQAQQKEFIKILDEHAKSKINAVFVQIRPSSDALYFSPIESWSEWLTGKHGEMPQPYYDPLTFMIEEAHLRGMEFHAWFNPFRALTDTSLLNIKNLPTTHWVKQKPEWFMTYGRNKLFNPALPEVREHISNIIADVARRYDIDGVHLDDYFYPYPIDNQAIDDEKLFKLYGQKFTNKEDWRRENINLLIEKISKTVKQTKPYLKFGISPFPVWRNQQQDRNGSATFGGLTAYDHLYADTRGWLSKGWVDYIAPQNYFSSQSDKVPYKTLTEWWTRNTFGRHLYIGHAVYKLNGKEDSKWTDKAEVANQIRFNRQLNLQGSIYYSSKSLTTNLFGFQDSLRENLHTHFALVPPMIWKDNIPPSLPSQLEAFSSQNGILLHWNQSPSEDVSYYVIYRSEDGEKISTENPKYIVGLHRQKNTFFLDKTLQGNGTYQYVVTAVDRLHNESMPTTPVKVVYDDRGVWADFLLTFASLVRELSTK